MRKYTAFFFSALLCVAFFDLGGCKDNSTNPTDYRPVVSTQNMLTITMAGNAFSPANVTIAKNTTITWYNNSSITHTSTSRTNVWDTGDIAPGSSKNTTFDTAGTFPYYCKYHSMMVGTVTVQ